MNTRIQREREKKRKKPMKIIVNIFYKRKKKKRIFLKLYFKPSIFFVFVFHLNKINNKKTNQNIKDQQQMTLSHEYYNRIK